jgi:7-cyano-7-deazaguanine synthase
MRNQAVVMTSGGMDSTVLLYWAINRKYEITPLFVDYGQHCAKTELAALRANLPHDFRGAIEIVSVSDVFKASPSRMIRETDLWTEKIESLDLMLPYRNLFLLVTGAAFAASRGSDTLMSAFINSNHAYEIDATSAFLEGAGNLIGSIGGVKLQMPFRDMSKAEVAEIGVSLGVPVARTFSCQVNAREHCGSCPNCVERLVAFETISRSATQ